MHRHDDAIAEAERATELDPLCLIVTSNEACVLYFGGRYDEAVAACQHVLEMDPGFGMARRLLGAAYLELGRPGDAVDELHKAVEAEGRQPVPLAWLGHGLAAAGRAADARAVLRELEDMASRRYVSPYRLALVHTGLGDKDAAFAALKDACDERAVGLVNVAVEPRFDPLRPDPRYRAVLRRMGLEPGPRLVAAPA